MNDKFEAKLERLSELADLATECMQRIDEHFGNKYLKKFPKFKPVINTLPMRNGSLELLEKIKDYCTSDLKVSTELREKWIEGQWIISDDLMKPKDLKTVSELIGESDSEKQRKDLQLRLILVSLCNERLKACTAKKQLNG